MSDSRHAGAILPEAGCGPPLLEAVQCSTFDQVIMEPRMDAGLIADGPGVTGDHRTRRLPRVPEGVVDPAAGYRVELGGGIADGQPACPATRSNLETRIERTR